MNQHQEIIAHELQIKSSQVAAVATLLNDGGTAPFIARYRKEATGLLDETQITAVRDRLLQLVELDKRRQAIITSLAERELLDQNLHQALLAASNLTILEDLYLPHRPKRRTRSIIAMERAWNLWLGQFFSKTTVRLTPKNSSTRAKVYLTPMRHWPGHVTLSRNGSTKIPEPEPGCVISLPVGR